MSAYTCFHCKMKTPDAPDTEPEIWNLISNHACLKDKVNLCLDENSVAYAEDQIVTTEGVEDEENGHIETHKTVGAEWQYEAVLFLINKRYNSMETPKNSRSATPEQRSSKCRKRKSSIQSETLTMLLQQNEKYHQEEIQDKRRFNNLLEVLINKISEK
ncbi:hypothetical protein QE152_g6492 [Popillia japonica]|uniref:Uncharacterized protein n=1 Tax=Popillia japonica TaxID=7064 RepID=A0AAW1MFC8_POPJA